MIIKNKNKRHKTPHCRRDSGHAPDHSAPPKHCCGVRDHALPKWKGRVSHFTWTQQMVLGVMGITHKS